MLGFNCRYDGDNNKNETVLQLLKEKDETIIPVCPEQLGGLPTPRNPSIVPEGGKSTLDGDGEVIMKGFGNVTSKFLKGAEETLKLAKLYDVDKAILKSESPSCGKEKISKNFKEKSEGTGVTAALLQKNGIEIISEKDL